jgi:predicted RNA binding protein YcfA (HicA-like mRNA interferase family)
VSSELPSISGGQAARALESAGFRFVSQKGSHAKFRDEAGRTTIIPMHGDLARGTLRDIIKQAGMTPEQFKQYL